MHRLVDAISYALEQKLNCSCVFLSISQAFDRVWHDGLLYKIKKFLPPAYYLIIKSYLIERHFQIRYGSALSDIAVINAGIPQGGILSPILYNFYASDQPTTPFTSVADYADDKVIINYFHQQRSPHCLFKSTKSSCLHGKLVYLMAFQS